MPLSKIDQVDILLQDPRIALLVRQIEELMAEHQRLVMKGKIPVVRIMGLHNGYSAKQ